MPQIKQILGSEYTHVRSLGVDELFIRRTPCSQATVALKVPPYRVPAYVDPSYPVQAAGRRPTRPVAPSHAAAFAHHHHHQQHRARTSASRYVHGQPQGQGFQDRANNQMNQVAKFIYG